MKNGILRIQCTQLIIGVFVAVGSLAPHQGASASSRLPEIPKNEIEVKTENLCKGSNTALQSFQADFGELLRLICTPEGQATPLLDTLVATPYQGQGDLSLTTVGFSANGDNVDIIFAVAMAFDRLNPVDALIGEEKHAIVPYKSARGDQDGLTMNFAFLEPEKNVGECDTKFKVTQDVAITGPGARALGNDGKDKSIHELRLFRLYPNNFDFFVSGRSLIEPTPLFAKSSVIRAFMPLPSDPSKTTSVTILHLSLIHI